MARPSPRAASQVQSRQSQLQAEKQQGPAALRVTETRTEIREGPIPSPDDLAAYDQLLPGAADRLIAMAEREQAFRHNLDDQAQRADIRHRDETLAAQQSAARGVFWSDMGGQVMGFLVATFCVGGAVYTAMNGAHWSIPVAFLGLPVASIIKAFKSNSNGGGK